MTHPSQEAAPPSSSIPGKDEFLKDVIAGLSATPKTLPYKYFYDEKGSQIFDQITALDEYYLTRTELQLLEQYGQDMGDWIGPGALLIEPGAGSCSKVEALLQHLDAPAGFMPIDISQEHLLAACERLQGRFPHIPIMPVVADYSARVELPELATPPRRSVVFYPGSTIGNFTPEGAVDFLTRLADQVGPGGGLLLGFDRKKDRQILEAAYNDSAGVTRAFHMNLLQRIKHELGADIDLEQFAHHAPFNEDESRIEMHLVSRCEQSVVVGGHRFDFAEGERICTEYSYKRTPEAMAALASQAGFTRQTLWTDQRELFAVMSFEAR